MVIFGYQNKEYDSYTQNGLFLKKMAKRRLFHEKDGEDEVFS